MLAAMLSLWATAIVPAQPEGARTVVASCDFEGPYSSGEQQIHDGCTNNWQWGRKDMLLQAEPDAGRPGTVQSIHVRGVTSGGMQFFYTRLKLKQDRYYRVSWWMKGDGLEAPINVMIRKIGYPWTAYVHGWSELPGRDWTRCTLTGRCAENVSDDVGVMWETGSLGKIWLDDLLVEESETPFTPAVAGAEPPPGNLLLRSSCEGRQDYLWSGGVYGQTVNGAYRGVVHEWEDPRPYRTEGGRFGRHCLAVPGSTEGGASFCRSTCIDTVPGMPYTFSAWVRADRPDVTVNLAFLYFGSERGVTGRGFVVGPEWQHLSVIGTPEATEWNQVYLQIATQTSGATAYVDGVQFEAGETSTQYAPRYPLELYADLGQDRGNLLTWGDTVRLDLCAMPAAESELKSVEAEVTVTGYPEVVVWRKALSLPVGRPQRHELRISRRGLFRVSMRTIDDALAGPQEMLFAILPEPHPTGGNSYFGTHITVRPFFIDYAHRIGMKWTRFHDACLITKWGCAEPEPGRYQWFDLQVDAIRAGGLHILALPDRPPKWAQREGDAGPIDVGAFARYCEAAARHYRESISYWEVWNEPYMPGFFGGSAEQFGKVLQAGYAALKRGSPEATVLGWCADISNTGFGASLQPEARRCLDIFSFHHYVHNLAGGGTLPFAGELADHLKLIGPAPAFECWNTEGTNWEVGGNSFYTFLPATREVNDRAAAFGSRVWLEHAKAGVSKYFVYTLHQSDTIMYYGGAKMLIGFDRSPTPAAVATATTAWCMDGLQTVPVEAVPGVIQAAFEGDGRATWAVYDDGGVEGRRVLRLDRVPESVGLLDVMGNDPRRDGVKTWSIGWQPLFAVSSKQTAAQLTDLVGKALDG